MTNDPEKRLVAHKAGKGGAYTASHLPVEMVYREKVGSRSDALKREYRIKQMTRQEKLALITGGILD